MKLCCERPRAQAGQARDLNSDPTRNPFLRLHQLWEEDDENLWVIWEEEGGRRKEIQAEGRPTSSGF